MVKSRTTSVCMRVLGIDPGTRFLGFGLVEVNGRSTKYLGHGVVRTDPTAPLAERLLQISKELQQVMNVYAPEAVAVEGVFTNKNARSALVLGHARGVALLLAAQNGVPVFEYAPARVKKSVGAGGNDGKDAVARMVTRLLALKSPLERSDAYDALAVALCHAHSAGSALPVASGRVQKGSAFASRLSVSYVAPAGVGS